MALTALRTAKKIIRRSRIMRTINRTTTVRVDEQRFRVPVIAGMRVMASENWMIGVLKALFALRSGPFVDVGVNLGQTLLKVRAVDPGREYIGFEPNPTCVDYVERIVKLNSFEHCHVLPVGIAEEPGIVTLDLFDETGVDSSATIVRDFRPTHVIKRSKNVAVLSAAEIPDRFLPQGIGLIKIDVEGAERDVLYALSEKLSRDRPLIILEILPCFTAEKADRIERQLDVENLFSELGYSLFRIRKDKGQFSHFEAVSKIGIHGDLELSDYVAAPQEIRLSLA